MHKCRSISGTLSDEKCILGFSSCSNVLRSHHHMLMSIDIPKKFQKLAKLTTTQLSYLLQNQPHGSQASRYEAVCIRRLLLN